MSVEQPKELIQTDQVSASPNDDSEIPEIPHITVNIQPYSEVVEKVCQQSYLELVSAVKELPSSKDSHRYYGNAYEKDLERKKKLLDLIVKIRNYFVKLYVLNKWSMSSTHFSKLIDLLNWLREQQMYFDSLVDNIKRIKIDLNFAKLPNHDLITSMIILNEYHYFNNKNLSLLPTYNLLAKPKLSNKFLLRFMKNLNSLLNLKISNMVLQNPNSELSSIIFKDCVVKDGKVYLTIKNEFQVTLTLMNLSDGTQKGETDTNKLNEITEATDKNEVANETKDEVDEKTGVTKMANENSSTEKAKPFEQNLDHYAFSALDFQFKFGTLEDGTVCSSENLSIPSITLNKILTHVNSVILFKKSENVFVNLYNFLHSYTLNYKLYLISEQLNRLINERSSIGVNKITWGNTLKCSYNAEKKLITIFYWMQKKLLKQKSYIQIGLNTNEDRKVVKNFFFKWYKDNKLFIEKDFDDPISCKFEFLEEVRTGDYSNERPNFEVDEKDINEEYHSLFNDNEFQIQSFLKYILSSHVKLQVHQVYQKLSTILSKGQESFEKTIFDSDEAVKKKSEPVELVSPYELAININDEKRISYSIDYLTGYSFFNNPSPSLNSICFKYQFHNFVIINNTGPSVRTSNNKSIMDGKLAIPANFADLEEALVISYQLSIIRMESIGHENMKILSVTEWIHCPSIKLDLNEVTELLNKEPESKMYEFVSNFKNFWTIQFYRMRNWPSNWFLISFVSNFGYKKFWLSQIKCSNGKWKVGYFEYLSTFSSAKPLTFNASLSLGRTSTNKISIHIVLQEFNLNKIKTNVPSGQLKNNVETLIKRLKFKNSTETSKSEDKLSIILLDNRSILSNHSALKNNLIFTVSLLDSEMIFDVYGQFKAVKIHLESLQGPEGFETDVTGKSFHIRSKISLHFTKSKTDFNYFADCFKVLHKVDRLAKLIEFFKTQLTDMSLDYKDCLTVTMDDILFTYDIGLPKTEQFRFKLVEGSVDLDILPTSAFNLVSTSLKSILNDVNQPSSTFSTFVNKIFSTKGIVKTSKLDKTSTGKVITKGKQVKNPGKNNLGIEKKLEMSLEKRSIKLVEKKADVLDQKQNEYDFGPINSFLRHLHVISPLIKTFVLFAEEHPQRFFQKGTTNDAPMSTEIKYYLSSKNLLNYSLIHEIRKEVKKDSNQAESKRHIVYRTLTKTSISFVTILGQRKLKLSMYPMGIENQSNGVKKDPTAQQFKTFSSILKKFLIDTFQLLSDKGNVSMSNDGLIADTEMLGDVLGVLHKLVIKKFK